MKKENVTIKPRLTQPEKIGMTKFLFSSYFSSLDGYDNDTFGYTPYLKELSEITAFFTYCAEGLAFETGGNADATNDAGEALVAESIYEAVTADAGLMALYEDVLSPGSSYPLLTAQLMDIRKDVEDMVNFEKQLLLSRQKDSLSELLDVIKNKIADIDVTRLDLNEFMKKFGKAAGE